MPSIVEGNSLNSSTLSMIELTFSETLSHSTLVANTFPQLELVIPLGWLHNTILLLSFFR